MGECGSSSVSVEITTSSFQTFEKQNLVMYDTRISIL